MKRLLATIGILLLPAQAQAFPDVPATYEFRRAVEHLQTIGVLQGYPDGTFRPTGTINRAELLKVLVAGQDIDPMPDFFRECFPDVVDQWYAPYVCYARQVGWVEGYLDPSAGVGQAPLFKPEQPVTFAEAIKMLTNVRGYPPAPEDEIRRRGLDPSTWFAPYLTTALLIDVVSFEQVWGDTSILLQSPVRRGFVAQMLYRALLAEGKIRTPLTTSQCVTSPSSLEIKTFVDVLMPSRTNVFRQDIRGVDASNGICTLATDINPFGRVTGAFDRFFLQPYPGGQPTGEWTVRIPLTEGRAILRGAGIETGGFRPEVFVIDIAEGALRQLPSIFAGAGGSLESADGRYIVFVGSAGYTLEAVDVQKGTHAVIDAVQPPLTFLAGPSNGQAVELSFVGTNVVTYSLYDQTEMSGDGYAILETRTADIDATMHPPSESGPITPVPEKSIEELIDDLNTLDPNTFDPSMFDSDSTVIDPNTIPFPVMP